MALTTVEDKSVTHGSRGVLWYKNWSKMQCRSI